MDEEKIIAGLKNNDEHTFRLFVEQYKDMVVNVCYGFVHDRDEALDISQEVFIKVYESVKDFRGDSKLSTWLYRIAVNKSLNALRKRKREDFFNRFGEMNLLNRPNHRIKIEPAPNEADTKLERETGKKIIHNLIRLLPGKQKAVFILFFKQKFSYKEISEILNISINEVGVLINRAKKKMQRLIKDKFQNDLFDL